MRSVLRNLRSAMLLAAIPLVSLFAQQDVHIVGGHVPVVLQQQGNNTAGSTSTTVSVTPTPPAQLNASTGTTLVVVCGVSNTGTISVGDNNTNVYTPAKAQTGTQASVEMWFVPNPHAGATTITCTAGTSGLVVVYYWEVLGLLAETEAQPDSTDAGTGSSLTSAVMNGGLIPANVNEIAFSAIMMTTNTACTVAGSWTLDGQGAGTGGRMCVLHENLPTLGRVTSGTAMATFSAASFAFVAATFQAITLTPHVAPDPCSTSFKTQFQINIASSSGATLITGASGKKIFICKLSFLTTTAQSIAMIEGTGTVCASGTAGMAGGTTAATGWPFGANGGMVEGNGLGTVEQTATAGDNVCFLPSGSGQISGSGLYILQ